MKTSIVTLILSVVFDRFLQAINLEVRHLTSREFADAIKMIESFEESGEEIPVYGTKEAGTSLICRHAGHGTVFYSYISDYRPFGLVTERVYFSRSTDPAKFAFDSGPLVTIGVSAEDDPGGVAVAAPPKAMRSDNGLAPGTISYSIVQVVPESFTTRTLGISRLVWDRAARRVAALWYGE